MLVYDPPYTESWSRSRLSSHARAGRGPAPMLNDEPKNPIAEQRTLATEIDRIADAIKKVGISSALETKLKTMEQRQTELTAEIRAADVNIES